MKSGNTCLFRVELSLGFSVMPKRSLFLYEVILHGKYGEGGEKIQRPLLEESRDCKLQDRPLREGQQELQEV